jgi:phosphatidylethanolamine/phosphatidyl-N-methylethanolamine N-methyltransferase
VAGAAGLATVTELFAEFPSGRTTLHPAEQIMTFLVEFVRNPLRTGALGGTTRNCVDAFLAGTDLREARRVVELGAGTGAITLALRDRLSPATQVLAVELNPKMADRLRRRTAGGNVEVVCASALELTALLRERNITAVDQVISSLPFSLMPQDDQREILRAVCDALDGGGGGFSTLLTAHQSVTRPGRRFDELLRQNFTDVERGPTLWANVPPLRAYHCRRRP